MKVFSLRNLIWLLLCISVMNTKAQCTAPLNTFPYVEDFENGPAWTTGGPACTPLNLVINDWQWGHPIKNVINSAGSGYKCWIAGDTSGWFYAYGERSWVQSPCFNFTNVQRPYVQMKVFYESEYKYDGANFQYSLNDGTTWITIGTSTENVDCMDTNWYNYSGVTHLGSFTGQLPSTGTTQTFQSLCTGTSTDGWCGNIQASYHDTTGVSNSTCQGGHGLGHWLTAKHCMPFLAGKPTVLFRIAFGAGTGCNNFNGFAFDSVAIGEGAPNSANFTTACVSSNTIKFTGIVPLCPDTFQWNFGDPGSGANNTILGAGSLTPTHTFSAPGTYTVTFTVKGGPCNAPGSISKVVNVIGLTTTTIPAGCTGTGGSAIVTVSGSASPYSYTWNTTPAQSTDTASGLAAGTYTVTVTTASACSATASATIATATPMTHTVTTVPTSCGASNGSAKVIESGGAPGYTYVWSGGLGTADSIKNVAGGSYILTITDSHGCTDTAHVTIAVGTGVTASISSTTPVSCHGGSNGSITVSASGGTPAYTYHWGSTTSTSATQGGFSAGTYVITVTDVNGCSATVSDNVSQPNAFSPTIATTPSTCGSSNGAAQVIEAGGTPGYTYIWSNALGTADSIKNVSAGAYTLTITDSKGCKDTVPVSVVNTGGVTASLDGTTPVTCPGGTDGTITVLASNGTTPYTYHWGSTTNTNSTQGGFAAGTYSITISDALGCIATVSATVSGPAAFSYTLSNTGTTCGNNNGAAKVIVSGGTPGYTYVWSGGLGSADSIKNAASGSYVLSITDSKGCPDTVHVTIAASSNPDATINSTTPVSCHGGNNGAITVTVNGGVSPYTYHWGTTTTTTGSQTGFTSGTYIITVTDVNGCSTTVSDNVSQPNALSPTLSITSANCNTSNGAAVVTEAGGTPNYTYIWSGGLGTTDSIHAVPAGSYTLTVTDSKGCKDTVPITIANIGGVTASLGSTAPVTCPGGTNGSITIVAANGTTPYTYHWGAATNSNATQGGFAAGSYVITVTDANGCIATVPVTVTGPPAFSHITTTHPTTCGQNNGSALIIESGGTLSYSYQWSNSLGTNDSITNAAPGTYTLSITDGVGCRDSVSVTIAASSPLAASVTGTVADSCYGYSDGSITVGVSNGTSPYTYHWGTTTTTVGTLGGLAVGNYTITVTDANNCTATVAATVNQPSSPITAIPTVTNATCNGGQTGAIALAVSGGNGNFTFQWSNTIATTQDIGGLSANTYNVTVTDQKGCTADTFATVLQPDPILITFPVVMPDSCYGSEDGTATASATGGTPGYTYFWSTGATTSTITGLAAGSYTVTVTDSNHCTATTSQSAVITSPDSLHATPSLVLDSCESSVGSISVIMSGGTSPYTYLWTPVSGSASMLSALPKGDYTLLVTDAHGCHLTAIYSLGDTCQRDSVVFPSAFTPNGDNVNDVYGPVYYGPTDDYQFHIYNRWGQLVFETTDPTKGWDGNYKGKPQPQDVYTYFATFSAYGKGKAREGSFMLFR